MISKLFRTRPQDNNVGPDPLPTAGDILEREAERSRKYGDACESAGEYAEASRHWWHAEELEMAAYRARLGDEQRIGRHGNG